MSKSMVLKAALSAKKRKSVFFGALFPALFFLTGQVGRVRLVGNPLTHLKDLKTLFFLLK